MLDIKFESLSGRRWFGVGKKTPFPAVQLIEDSTGKTIKPPSSVELLNANSCYCGQTIAKLNSVISRPFDSLVLK